MLQRAGIDVIDIVLEPIASAAAVLTEDEKDLGAALVDIGGGTTDIAIYKDGKPQAHSGSCAWRQSFYE